LISDSEFPVTFLAGITRASTASSGQGDYN